VSLTQADPCLLQLFDGDVEVMGRKSKRSRQRWPLVMLISVQSLRSPGTRKGDSVGGPMRAQQRRDPCGF
jgi:hypothetical protein